MVSEATRHVMQANKSKNTKPELKVRAALRAAGPSRVSPPLEGRARQARHLLSRPQGGDLRQRLLLASLPYCALSTPKTNVEFWTAKFERNRARDQRDCDELANAGWTVVVIWECRLKRGRFDATMDELVRIVRRGGAGRA